MANSSKKAGEKPTAAAKNAPASQPRRIVVDPVTRIEGHLRIEAETDAQGVITRASSSGTMVRGIELILKGRDPRDAWAFTQRFCGVCTVVHSIASIRAVEYALGYVIPENAQHIRNLMIAAQYVHDHVMHFYHLHALDWVDVVSALKADPAATSKLQVSLSPWPNNSPAYFGAVQQRLKGFVESGQLGIFANGYWGHPEYKLPPEVNLLAIAHYLEALAWQRDVVKIHAIFGGKNPHPNFVVGGVPCAISATSHATAVNGDNLRLVGEVIDKMRQFVDQVYLPDTLAIAGFYKDWATRGEGVGNFLSYGEFPTGVGAAERNTLQFPPGVIINRDLAKVHPVNFEDPTEIQEFVAHSWYSYSAGKQVGLHPYDGETKLDYTGPKPPYEQLDVDQSYSWIKSPRWKGLPVEVGPLARVLILYASGEVRTRGLVDHSLGRLGLPISALFSTLGRVAARTIETKLIADMMPGMYDALMANIARGDLRTFDDVLFDPTTWPKKTRGVGMMEAPRGALAHWLTIEEGRIGNYQAVVPSTWNAGPRDAAGREGPYEAALRGHKLQDPSRPLEILRTIHSFDPCLACAVHVVDPKGEELVRVRVL
ncbi:nickel-dependent hydrogenase large subunit [Bradyrhizobium diazoefficiens]|nr:nickel-dependent hydrogenase large subunit [Bradyrhizobium diazoefficiens]MBR0965593.1 nickel-dependent hydrogenase large subunit [Bradyrhizobium diazoefficiens]MBR0979285.1 nickel-dependent hydrogenase large subunit [Bradyrhizobium diazoefficiens]MBR1008677.1 nickel-dependent hydrogenase large subunit [Bradyrhizobium diazoefficiens]MBR1014774.1 nickel-dependent hydrogenase large subunit [Bradyrhizobium diazoefficiens]MBR1052638.1 nickel-dependent hydrogenase large subunit [Bradyrhizobium d